METKDALNRRGYRRKSYTSRRDVFHPGGVFYVSTVQYLLKNPAYSGRKEITKRYFGREGTGKEPRLVDASWPAIVSLDKFEAVQRLMQENGQTNRNAAEPVRHAYVLSRGVLHCGRCGDVMEGRSGTGRLGTKYFYYVCRSKDCGLRVAADEIEAAVLERIRKLAGEDTVLERLTVEANTRMLKQKPALEKQRQGLAKSLTEVKSQADRLLEQWTELEGESGVEFVKIKLGALSARRQELETGIAELDNTLQQMREQSVTSHQVRQALVWIDAVYGQLKPFERRELMGAVLKSATVSEHEITLEIYTLGEQHLDAVKSVDFDEKVRTAPIWLPEWVNTQNFPGHLRDASRSI